MTQIATPADGYATQFAAFAQATALPEPFASLRDDAFGCFDRLGFPTTRLEEWRYTNVAPIADTAFVP
ncbi:MAG TPA: Fe-S cluster assembly protein SufD, partial [Acidobacteria bacterium]|nr:Fe-S cluster assembly protein SufD [Acidobacteriota bacterium]